MITTLAQNGSPSHEIGASMTMQRRQQIVDDAIDGEHRLEQHRIGDQRGDAGQEDRRAEESRGPRSLGSLSATANSSASTIMIGTCTTRKIKVLHSARRNTGSLVSRTILAKPPKLKVHALADLEAHPERPEDRIDHEDAEQHQCRRDEQPAVDLLAAAQPRNCAIPVPRRNSGGNSGGNPCEIPPALAIRGRRAPPPAGTYWIC